MCTIIGATANDRTFTVEICPAPQTCACPQDRAGNPIHPSYTFNNPTPTELAPRETPTEWQRRHAIEALRLAARPSPPAPLAL